MTRPLPERPTLHPDYRCRSMRESDLDDTARMMHASYGTRGGRYIPSVERTRRFLAASLVTDGDDNLVVLHGDDVVGYYGMLHRRGRYVGGGPCAVHPEHRNAGLYTYLILQTLWGGIDAGASYIRHQMPFFREVFRTIYGRLGLEFTGEAFAKLERRPGRPVPPPSSHRATPLSSGDLDAVVAFDREHFLDADRSPDYRFMIDLMDGCGWRIERDGELRGFAFSVPGMVIGPVAGLDHDAAIDALRVATACDEERGVKSGVHINFTDRTLVEEAFELGYQFSETVLMMERPLDGSPMTPPITLPYCSGLFGVP